MVSHAPTLVLPVTERDHIEGSMNAPVILVEYGDYECPYCGAAYPIVKEVQRRMRENLCFAFRNFPLTEIHPHAGEAAQAAEAADLQGKFWPMHDALFEQQELVRSGAIERLAAGIKLDMSRFAEDASSAALVKRVREDFMSGVRSGVNGTPTFFINGARYDRAWDLPELLASLEEEVASQT